MSKKFFCFIIYFFVSLLFVSSAFATHSSNEAFSRMLQLKEQGKIPAYVVERGQYKYIEGNSVAHVKGKNVFMRSQPQKKARIITKLTNIDLEYLGEWTHPQNAEKWICVREKMSDKIGWIYGQYIELLGTNNTKGKQIQVTSEENQTIYKKNKNCIEDPCGALGGLLFISPILYLFAKIEEGKTSGSGNTVPSLEFSLLENDKKEKCCPNYERSFCDGCWELSNNSFGHLLYTKCNYFGKYVQTSRSPQYNAKNLESFENECCPYYEKYTCGNCPYMDYSDSYYDYYKCKYFNAYVQADESPQYNSEHLKYS